MGTQVQELTIAHKRTRFAHIWMRLTSEPFVVLTTLLAFILRKDLGATEWHLSLLASIRPIMSVLSFYWGSGLKRRPEKLRSNLIGAWVLARAPFFCLPFFPTIWYVIFCMAVYQLFERAGTPALVELMKLNLPKLSRERVFTWTFAAGFVECVGLSLFLGTLLEKHTLLWPWLVAIAAFLSLTSIALQQRIPSPPPLSTSAPSPLSLTQRLITPWQEGLTLLKLDPAFAKFQAGFMVGGFGLMLMAPAYIIYYTDVLGITHNTLTLGRCLWMSIGVMLSSSFWQLGIGKLRPGQLTRFVCFGFALHPLSLLMARFEAAWFYLAFLFYGIAQAGSHLVWNLSGTLFAKEKDSSGYTVVNILSVGLRGAIAPFLGAFLCKLFGPTFVLTLGMGCCFCGAWIMRERSANRVLNLE